MESLSLFREIFRFSTRVPFMNLNLQTCNLQHFNVLPFHSNGIEIRT